MYGGNAYQWFYNELLSALSHERRERRSNTVLGFFFLSTVRVSIVLYQTQSCKTCKISLFSCQSYKTSLCYVLLASFSESYMFLVFRCNILRLLPIWLRSEMLQVFLSGLVALINIFCVAVLLGDKKFRTLDFVCIVIGSLAELIGALFSLIAYFYLCFYMIIHGCLFPFHKKHGFWIYEQ